MCAECSLLAVDRCDLDLVEAFVRVERGKECLA